MKNENTWKSRKKMSKLLGTLRKKGKKGTYYYRVQVANGERREFSLKTSDPALAASKHITETWDLICR